MPRKEYIDWLITNLEGVNQRELADYVGLRESAISKMKVGRREIKAHELEKIAEFLNSPPPTLAEPGQVFANHYGIHINVVASIGMWRDPAIISTPSEIEEEQILPVLPDFRLTKLPQKAALVLDTHCDETIPSGAFAIYTPYWSIRDECQHNDLVLMAATQGNLCEFTVRRLSIGKNTTLNLDTKKSNRKFESISDISYEGPMLRDDYDPEADAEITLVGLVFSAYQQFPI